MNKYSALKEELRRLKKRKRVGDVSDFLAEYIYARLSLLDLVALIGGEPSGALYSREAGRLLEQPAAARVVTKVLSLMQVSEDWTTFQHLYERAWAKNIQPDKTAFEKAFSVLVSPRRYVLQA